MSLVLEDDADSRSGRGGWTNAGIGEQLGIATRVAGHIHSILSKLHLADSEHTSRRGKAALLTSLGQAG